jgi:hypothetical protein
MDINKELKGYNDPAVTGVTELPTETGFFLSCNYFTRKPKDSGINPGASFFTGPGIFFDYKFSDNITFSYDMILLLDQRSVYDKSRALNFGLFMKHWINPGWGYLGAGFEFLSLKGETRDKSVSEKDYMITFILTGENVKIKNRMNAVGDLRFSVSFLDNTEGSETRYSFKYSIGFGFEL